MFNKSTVKSHTIVFGQVNRLLVLNIPRDVQIVRAADYKSTQLTIRKTTIYCRTNDINNFVGWTAVNGADSDD